MIQNIIFEFLISIAVIVLQVLLPGFLLGVMLARKKYWTLVDAFFLGILWNVAVGVLVTPFTHNTATISAVNMVATAILISIYLIACLSWKWRPDRNIFRLVVNRSVTRWHFSIASISCLILVVFIVTHNIGFDDVSNLRYLNAIKQGSIFPEFSPLVSGWEAARYPMWGTVIGVLSYTIPKGTLFLYYFLGACIIVSFLLKAYEFIISAGKNNYIAFCAVSLIASILMIGGWDNYFNFGIYPLQQAKLLYITGLLYVLVGWVILRNPFNLFLGIGITTAAAFYHINIILLHLVFLLVSISVIFFYVKNTKKWFRYVSYFVLPLFLVLPAAIAPNHGFIRDESEQVDMSDNENIWMYHPEMMIGKIKKMYLLIAWIGGGNRYIFYIKRAFSLEVWLIPIILILFVKINVLSRLGSITVLVSSFIMLQQILTTVPFQFLSSLIRSSTVWMVYDIMQSGLITNDNNRYIYTDPYTSLYLKLLDVKNVQKMSELNEIMAFSPLFPQTCKQYVASQFDEPENSLLLLNGRYWGIKSINRWGVESGTKFDHFIDNITKYRDTENIQLFPVIVRSGMRHTIEQINLPIITYQQSSETEYNNDCIHKMLDRSEKNVMIHRDVTLVTFSDIKAGEIIKLGFEDKGYSITYIDQITIKQDVKILKPIPNIGTNPISSTKRTREATFKAAYDAKNVILIFRSQLGHFNGLGSINLVSVLRTQ